MANILRKDIQIPVVIQRDNRHCDIYIPDLDMTVHGRDYVDTISKAIMTASAVYYYNLERNLQIKFKTPYAEVEKMCLKHHGSFASYIGLVP